jgi:glucosylceramidase
VLTVDTAKATYTRSVEYYALGHASKFVMPGARRIASSGGDSTLTHVAFRNPGTGSVALIVLNTDARARSFVVRGGAGSFSYELPAASVVTFLMPVR